MTLFVLNVAGGRVINVSQACGPSHTYFAASKGFKAVVQQALGQQNSRNSRQSLDNRGRRSSQDLDFLQSHNQVLPALIRLPVLFTLVPRYHRSLTLYAWKLPTDESPVQPPQLHSKK